MEVSLPSLFSLCVKAIPLSPIDAIFIVDRCKNLQLIEMSHSTDERDDECRLLASECDVILIYILGEFLKDAVSRFVIP